MPVKERSAASREETKPLEEGGEEGEESRRRSGGSGRGKTVKGVTSEGRADLHLTHADSLMTVPAQGLTEAE